jgi:hypothetical protein
MPSRLNLHLTLQIKNHILMFVYESPCACIVTTSVSKSGWLVLLEVYVSRRMLRAQYIEV